MSGRPQRLVCLATTAAIGGAETSLLTLLRALRQQEPGWTITVVAPSEGPLLTRCAALGVRGMVLPYPAALTRLGESGATGSRRRSAHQVSLAADGVRALATVPGYLQALRQALVECDATVVHTNGIKAHIAGALARPAGIRLVWHLHEYVRARPLTASLLRRLVSRTDVVVVNSDSVLRDAHAAFRGRARLRRIYNAVEPDRFTPQGARLDLAALAGMPDDAGLVRIGLVATFGRWKGQDVFIDAVAALPRHAAVRAYIVGGAVYGTTGSQWSLDDLRERVQTRGLAATIGFTGHVDDVPAALRSLDVVVHASTRPEPFGMVIAEAMAAGRAVVAVRDGGAMELFEDRVEAVGVPLAHAGALSAVLSELIDRAEWRACLGARARAAARSRFSPARMAAEFREACVA